jgi:hypothetical protein
MGRDGAGLEKNANQVDRLHLVLIRRSTVRRTRLETERVDIAENSQDTSEGLHVGDGPRSHDPMMPGAVSAGDRWSIETGLAYRYVHPQDSADTVASPRRTGLRWAALGGSVVLIGTTIVAVQSMSCGHGVHTSEAALRALISACRDASDTRDVCRYVTPGFDYTMSDVDTIAIAFATVDPDDVIVTTTDQLGTLVFLTASTPDGSASLDVTATDNEGKRATIDLGSYPASDDQ